jgi:HK97 gp10 family phage protein
MSAHVDGQLQDFVELMTLKTKENSPVDTGNNRSSITYERLGPMKWRVFTQSGYGAYLELGTFKMPARPYFATAFRQAVASFKAQKHA